MSENLNALSNKRHEGEDFKTYRDRLKALGQAISTYIRGVMVFRSVQIIRTTEDTRMYEARGLYRDMKPAMLKDGNWIMLGKTKGVSYKRNEMKTWQYARLRKAFI